MVSIVVPVYNTAAWVGMTLASLSSSLLTNAELIVIDDGSTDDSFRCLPDLLAEFPGQVVLLKQPNQGLSATRNTGVCLARGDWIAFCDSDDWLNASTLMTAINRGDRNHADAVFWRSTIYDDINQTLSPFYDEKRYSQSRKYCDERVTTFIAAPELLGLEPNINTGVYRRSFWLHNVGFFHDGKVFEDLVPHYRVLFSEGKIILMDMVGYYYRVGRPGKITEERSHRRRDMVDAVAGVIDAVPATFSSNHCRILMGQLLRMLHWSGVASLPEDRQPYYVASCLLFEHARPRQMLATAFRTGLPARQAIIALALLVGSSHGLSRLAAGYRWSSLPFLIPGLLFRPTLWFGIFRQMRKMIKGSSQ